MLLYEFIINMMKIFQSTFKCVDIIICNVKIRYTRVVINTALIACFNWIYAFINLSNGNSICYIVQTMCSNWLLSIFRIIWLYIMRTLVKLCCYCVLQICLLRYLINGNVQFCMQQYNNNILKCELNWKYSMFLCRLLWICI